MTVVLISSIFHFLLVVPSGRPPLLLEATVEELVTGLDELDIVEVISELMEAAWEGGVVPAVEGVEEVERLDIDEEERPTRTWAIPIVSRTTKEGSTVTLSAKGDLDDDGSFPTDAGFSVSRFLTGCDLI